MPRILSPKAIFEARQHLRVSLRKFFHNAGYLEIDTPIMVKMPGTEFHLRYFATDWVDYTKESHRRWLRSSPELHMKRALSTGLEAIFQMGPCFRNHGELSPWHHPEFTMLEWYKTGVTFESFLVETENLLRATRDDFKALGYQVFVDDIKAERFTLKEAFQEFADISLVDQDPDLARQARAKGCVSAVLTDDFETTFFKILIEKIEPALARIPFSLLYDYPASQAALARVDQGVAKRFEFYVRGIELSNGFWELLGAAENRQRIEEAHQFRAQQGYEIPQEDQGFYEALEQGLPDCFGNALGFDRWLALLLGGDSLDCVLPFRKDIP